MRDSVRPAHSETVHDAMQRIVASGEIQTDAIRRMFDQNGGMPGQRLIVLLLALCSVCLDAVLLSHVGSEEAVWPALPAVLLLGALLGQLGLVAAWAAFGQANVATRALGFVVMQLLVARLGGWTAAGRVDSWSLAIGLFATAMLAIYLGCRLLQIGMSWHQRDPYAVRNGMGGSYFSTNKNRFGSDPASLKTDAPQAWQFNLWQLLSLTTASALLLTFWSQQQLNWSVALPSALFFGFLAIVCGCSLWTGLRGHLLFNIAVLIAGLIAARGWYQWLDFTSGHTSSLIGLVLAMQFVTLASAMILRAAGLRLTPALATKKLMKAEPLA